MKEILILVLFFSFLGFLGFKNVESDSDLVARYRRPSTTVLLPIGYVKPKIKTVDDHINEAAEILGLRKPLFRGMIHVESRWNPKARREEKKLKTRSVGLTQVLATTAAAYGVREKELEDPETAIWVGGMYLRDCIKHERGDEFFGVVCYNAGPRKNRSLYPKGAIEHARKVIKAAKIYG